MEERGSKEKRRVSWDAVVTKLSPASIKMPKTFSNSFTHEKVALQTFSSTLTISAGPKPSAALLFLDSSNSNELFALSRSSEARNCSEQ